MLGTLLTILADVQVERDTLITLTKTVCFCTNSPQVQPSVKLIKLPDQEKDSFYLRRETKQTALNTLSMLIT